MEPVEFELVPFFDLSFSVLRPDQVRWLWGQGFRGAAQDLWTGGYAPATLSGDLIAPRNLQTLIDSGLPWWLHGYIVVDERAPGGWHVNQGWGHLVGADFSRLHLWSALESIWVDDEVPGTSLRTVRAGLERVVALGKDRTIYTRRPFFVDEQGDSPDFRDCSFILANYDGNPDPYVGFRPFASCDRSNYRGKQYHNTKDEDGVDVDLDTLILPVEEDDMWTPQQGPVAWIRAQGAGAPLPYRTYTFDGARKTLVASAEQEAAFLALGFIAGQPKDLPLEQVKAIPSAPGTMEPDAP